MSEYYKVLKHDLSFVATSSSEGRRAVYDKKRRSVVGDLNGQDSRFLKKEDIKNGLELESAIRKVEMEILHAKLRELPGHEGLQSSELVSASICSTINNNSQGEVLDFLQRIQQQHGVEGSVLPSLYTMAHSGGSISATFIIPRELENQRKPIQQQIEGPVSSISASEEVIAIDQIKDVSHNSSDRIWNAYRLGYKKSFILPSLLLAGTMTGIAAFALLYGYFSSHSIRFGTAIKKTSEVATQKGIDRVVSRTFLGEFIDNVAVSKKEATSHPKHLISPYKVHIVKEGFSNAGDLSKEPDGYATWRVTRIVKKIGEPSTTALQGDIKLVNSSSGLAMSIRRNMDTSVAASYIIELRFPNAEKFQGKRIADIDGISVRLNKNDVGRPLLGVTAKITDGLFWIALSNNKDDVEHNLTLIKNAKWWSVPILYKTGERAAVLMAIPEKINLISEVFSLQ